jgi:hypothetical protein
MARCRQCGQAPHASRDYFCVPNRRRLLGEVKELTAEDWAFIWIAYQGFLAQVNLIVQRARERTTDMGRRPSSNVREAMPDEV